MRECWILLACGVMTACAAQVTPTDVSSGERGSQNAALQYWLAFAEMPTERKDPDELSSFRKLPHERGEAIVKDWPTALKFLRRGAAMAEADWGLESGPVRSMPFLSKARTLAELACLSTRVKIEDGDAEGGVDDAVATIHFARHLGANGNLISVVFGYAIEGLDEEALADVMWRMKPGDLVMLRRRWATLPPQRSIADAIRCERRMMVGWAMARIEQEKDPARLAAEFEAIGLDVPGADAAALKRSWTEVDRQYERAAEIASLPWAEFGKPYAKFQQRVQHSENFIPDVLSAYARGRFMQARARVTRGLIDAGAAYLHGGEAEFRTVRDPFEDGPFVMKKTAKGFELSSGLKDEGNRISNGKPVTLEFITAAGRK